MNDPGRKEMGMSSPTNWICRKRGHKSRVTRHTLYTKTKEYRAVADRVVVERSRCRCGHVSAEREVSREGIQGLTMHPNKWDALNEHGQVEV